jgi:cell division protein FtsW (lipid II flippase)
MALPLIPRTISDQPWTAIFSASFLAFLGFITLYSAAGGKLMPWALPHGARFGVFLLMALALSYLRPSWWKEWIAYIYIGVMALLFVVLAIGVVGGGAKSWDRFRPDPAPAFGAHEADPGDRAGDFLHPHAPRNITTLLRSGLRA